MEVPWIAITSTLAVYYTRGVGGGAVGNRQTRPVIGLNKAALVCIQRVLAPPNFPSVSTLADATQTSKARGGPQRHPLPNGPRGAPKSPNAPDATHRQHQLPPSVVPKSNVIPKLEPDSTSSPRGDTYPPNPSQLSAFGQQSQRASKDPDSCCQKSHDITGSHQGNTRYRALWLQVLAQYRA
jgi:hypothetical protein